MSLKYINGVYVVTAHIGKYHISVHSTVLVDAWDAALAALEEAQQDLIDEAGLEW